jgi:Mg2+/Co2+ transporter CorB
VADLRVRDIMIPRAHMVVVEQDLPLERILPVVIESAHSRFPVIGDDRGEVLGILLAKDLLSYCGGYSGRRFDIRDLLRAAVFVPESKRLNVLLNEFRSSRNHMAIVVDEFGAAAGLVTIEDVLEQIVGDAASGSSPPRPTRRSTSSTPISTVTSGTTSSTPSRAWSHTPSATSRSAAKRWTSASSVSRSCGPTAAPSTS